MTKKKIEFFLNVTILFTLGKFYSSPSKRLRYEASLKEPQFIAIPQNSGSACDFAVSIYDI